MTVNPQLEDGYTRIAHELLEIMAKTKLSPTQYRIIFAVWRYTYGFGRKSHHLSLSFLAQATGCDRRSLQREVKRLLDWKILIEYSSKRQARKIGFNKRFNQWTVGETTNGKTTATEALSGDKTTNGNSVNGSSATGGKTTTSSGGETANSSGGETATQDIKKIKNNIIHDTREENSIETAYFDSLGTLMTKHNFEVVNSYLKDGLTEWHICEALRRTSENNKNSFRYTMGILNNWIHQQAFTKEDVERLDKARQIRPSGVTGAVTADEFTYTAPEQDKSKFSFLSDEEDSA